MKKPILINDCAIDVEKISFISNVDSKVFAHINRVEYFFVMIIDGNEQKIQHVNKKEVSLLRDQLLHECGALIKSEFIGLMPS